MTAWLLVHSPLVGPSTWRPVADSARARGIEVVVPDLTGVAEADEPIWKYFVSQAESAPTGLDDVVVVGHSGAGVFLPAIGERLADHLSGLVFVDAVVPPRTGAHTTPPELTSLLDSKTHNDVLEVWFDWWPEGAIEKLVPDDGLLDALRFESPRLTREFYDETVPMPSGWADWPCGYIHLSEAYDQEAVEARQRGWPMVSLNENHLSIVTKPEVVVDAISTIASSMLGRDGGEGSTPI